MSRRLSVVIQSHGVEAEKNIQITTAQPSLVLFFEAISGFGEVANADGMFVAFSAGDARGEEEYRYMNHPTSPSY